jgi:4a-hydroxytetrahydrobiopterin dehydratase
MPTKLTASEIDEALQSSPNWKIKDEKLVREWTFKDFLEAMTFVNRIAEIAERAGHHPDIDIRYNKVLLGLVSHDAGGITKRDATMAIKIDTAFP